MRLVIAVVLAIVLCTPLAVLAQQGTTVLDPSAPQIERAVRIVQIADVRKNGHIIASDQGETFAIHPAARILWSTGGRADHEDLRIGQKVELRAFGRIESINRVINQVRIQVE